MSWNLSMERRWEEEVEKVFFEENTWYQLPLCLEHAQSLQYHRINKTP